MLYQLSYSRLEPVAAPVAGFRKNGSVTEWWGEQDSNLRSCEAADLQSAPVGRLGISPWSAYGANGGTRTPDRLITNQLLYQLSYIGLYNKEKNALSSPLHDRMGRKGAANVARSRSPPNNKATNCFVALPHPA